MQLINSKFYFGNDILRGTKSQKSKTAK